ncbi:MAG: DUF2779 domain-containing protein [Candidatus Pacebacteria bacterium]|nr:DUF2779 domain-containing protein [Candidatus Paceibacterota bacterium]
MNLSKTDYILYRECPKNAWMKIHRPDVYYASELSEFEKHIIETGNEVELVARQLFPSGVLIEGRDEKARLETLDLIAKKDQTIFQPIFVKDGFLAAVDVLKYDPENDGFQIYEIKASNEVDEKVHLYDLAFQVALLRKCGIKVTGINLLHLNKEYVRDGELDIIKLFSIDDVREAIEDMLSVVSDEMDIALAYLSAEKEPNGHCCCVYKGRSSHCSTFKHSNPHVPEYSVHDLNRIGSSKKKLMELIDSNVFHIHEADGRIVFSESQQNQIDAHVYDRVLIKKDMIAEEFSKLEYPLYFLDYETFPSAVPLFDGYSSYNQIPFQYSLHVLETPESELKSYEFLHMGSDDPCPALVESLQSHIGLKGSVIVWYKPFEKSRNTEMGIRLPGCKEFFESVNGRVFDLMEIFSKQYYVHKDFKGSSSIKKVLPVLVPELSYKELLIKEGGSASQAWKKLVDGKYSKEEAVEIANALKVYCNLDTYAMYMIFKRLNDIL